MGNCCSPAAVEDTPTSKAIEEEQRASKVKQTEYKEFVETPTTKLTEDQIVDELLNCMTTGEKFPIITQKNPTLTIEESYRIQKKLVHSLAEHVGQPLEGYKAGFTRGENAELLRKRNYKPPLFGHLNPRFVVDLAKEENKIELDLSRVHFLEPCIAFTLEQDVDEELWDLDDVKKCIATVQPAIEVVVPPYHMQDKFLPEDVIATNLFSTGLILSGIKQKPIMIDPESIDVTLRMDDKLVTGSGRDIKAGQWEIVMQILNFAVRNGWQVQRGMHIVTGCIGRPILAAPGKYYADFGTHIGGTIGDCEFIIEGDDTVRRDFNNVDFWEKLL